MSTPIIISSTPTTSGGNEGYILIINVTGFLNTPNLIIELDTTLPNNGAYNGYFNGAYNGRSFTNFNPMLDSKGNGQIQCDISAIFNNPEQLVFPGSVFKINIHNNKFKVYSPNTYTIVQPLPIKIMSSSPTASSEGNIITIYGTGFSQALIKDQLIIELRTTLSNGNFNGRSFTNYSLSRINNDIYEIIVDISDIFNNPEQPVFIGEIFQIRVFNDRFNLESYSPDTYLISSVPNVSINPIVSNSTGDIIKKN